MRKLLILLLLPFMLQCSKDPVEPTTPDTKDTSQNPVDTTQNQVSKKCYINKTSYSSNSTSFVYERDAQNRTVKIKNQDGSNITGHTVYTYNDNALAKVESFDKDGNLVGYSTTIQSGNNFTISGFGKKENDFQEVSRYMLTYSNGKYSKLTYFSRNATSGKFEKTSESLYNYAGDGLSISQYDINGNLTLTAYYTFDDKKNAMLNAPSILPQISEHNSKKIIYKDKDGKETYNYAVEYTYNENGYPLTATSGTNTTTYTYECK